jgi:archaeal preflagellin peptidase FlaK
METFQAILLAANIALSIGFLLYASYRDYKAREVSNKVWAFYAPIGLTLSLVELLLYEQSQLPFYALSFGATAGIALLLFYAGGFGGADSKALMCIGLALPFAPLALFTPLLVGGLSPIMQFIFPLTIFSNSVLFAAATGIYMIVRNVVWHKQNGVKMFSGTLASESIGKKIVVLITGYKMKVEKLKEKWHIFPMEDLEDTGGTVKRKLVVVPHDEGRGAIVERLSNAIETKKIDGYVWATPGLPMLIFVTLGMIVALFFGDLIWLLVRFVLG